MKTIGIAIGFIFSAGFYIAHSQNIFPEKFGNCVTDEFALESDSATAKIQDEQLLNILKQSFDEKTIKKIRGTLLLQILVDFNGNSCLISLKNGTNMKTKKLNLTQSIDEGLKWNRLEKKIALIIAFRFEENGIRFKRLGMNANTGVHELPAN